MPASLALLLALLPAEGPPRRPVATYSIVARDPATGEGGDSRGRQSAAIVVVKARASGKPWADRVFDLRVDDNPAPLVELRRLVKRLPGVNQLPKDKALLEAIAAIR